MRSSPIGQMDPIVRALNTVMYGVVVHFVALVVIARCSLVLTQAFDHSDSTKFPTHDPDVSSSSSSLSSSLSSSSSLVLLWWILLLHEYWIFLQHANVFGNPLCQRLDRQYGIALLKSNQHWAIAGTLSAYWCRESLSMFLSLPFLTTHTTKYLVLYSLIYHAIKSRGVRHDALQRHSSSFGIMRVVIDKFYFHTTQEKIASLLRLFLQGFDTWIHLRILTELYSYDKSNNHHHHHHHQYYKQDEATKSQSIHLLFVIWVAHAAMNQLFRCSTASVMVQTWKALTTTVRNTTASLTLGSTTNKQQQEKKNTNLDSTTNSTLTLTQDQNEPWKQPPKDSNASVAHSDSDTADESEDATTTTTTTTTIAPNEHTKETENDYIVRDLLRKGRVPDAMKGPRGVASRGVDASVKLETIFSVIGTLYIAIFRDEIPAARLDFRSVIPTFAIPIQSFTKILSRDSMAQFLNGLGVNLTQLSRIDQFPPIWMTHLFNYSIDSSFITNLSLGDQIFPLQNAVVRGFRSFFSIEAVIYCWLLGSVLLGASSLILPTQKNKNKKQKSSLEATGPSRSGQRKLILRHTVEVSMLAYFILNRMNTYDDNEMNRHVLLMSGLLAVALAGQSFFLSAVGIIPPLFWKIKNYSETLLKLALAQKMHTKYRDELELCDVVVCGLWILYVLRQRVTWWDDGVSSTIMAMEKAPDIVFLGHPAELHDCWAMWLMPYSLQERWTRPWWAVPLWPIHYLVGQFTCNIRRKVFGDRYSFSQCDDVTYGGIHMQTWTSVHFARHFVTSKANVKLNIEASARYADSIGVKVLCLGALNKAESINGGGVGVVRALGGSRSISVIHGNHLTAAAVVDTTHQACGNKAKVFLTGASSKVGWAVAKALREWYGYDVLCHSTDAKRRQIFRENGFRAAATLKEGTLFSRIWIVGKYDLAVPDYIPHGSTAIVFSVPHPLKSRPDVRVIEAGTLHMDLTRLDRPRQFTNKLQREEIFACHAAGAVAAHRLKEGKQSSVDEVGPVNHETMNEWLNDARSLGFSIPYTAPISQEPAVTEPCVVVIGAGPAGLATAAGFQKIGVKCIILEKERHTEKFGSWESHFQGLEVTTHKKYCGLPGFAVKHRDFPEDHVTASNYQHYLNIYAHRFSLDIRRGYDVVGVEKGDTTSAWIVRCSDKTVFRASVVVVATGKNAQANKQEAIGELQSQLHDNNIMVVHSTEMKNDAIWNEAIEAAKAEKLCVVGFGNSASDICTAILKKCDYMEGCIHIAARTVPFCFPREYGPLRLDTVGLYVRRLPTVLQEVSTSLFHHIIPPCKVFDGAFPAHIPRWSKIDGRVPVVDKHNVLSEAFKNGQLIGHGRIHRVSDNGVDNGAKIWFDDRRGKDTTGSKATAIADTTTTTIGGNVNYMDSASMVILATGYSREKMVDREDRLNGLFLCGFMNENFLPLMTIGEESKKIVAEAMQSGVLLSKTPKDIFGTSS